MWREERKRRSGGKVWRCRGEGMCSRKNRRVNEEKEDCVAPLAHKVYKANHSACEVCVCNPTHNV